MCSDWLIITDPFSSWGLRELSSTCNNSTPHDNLMFKVDVFIMSLNSLSFNNIHVKGDL